MPGMWMNEMFDDRNALTKWRITKDFLSGGTESDAAGTCGPRNCPDDDKDAEFTWTKFRLYDDDGELYYEGEWNEHCEGLDPLDDFGTPNAGCTELRELTDGGWKTV